MTSLNPFDYLNSINYNKNDIMKDDVDEDVYVSFLINRSLSYFSDTVSLANIMNQHWMLENKLQYHFLINTIRKRKRFSKWIKPELESGIEAIKEYYGYNNEKARQALTLLSPEQITIIKEKVNKGGRK